MGINAPVGVITGRMHRKAHVNVIFRVWVMQTRNVGAQMLIAYTRTFTWTCVTKRLRRIFGIVWIPAF